MGWSEGRASTYFKYSYVIANKKINIENNAMEMQQCILFTVALHHVTANILKNT